MLVSSLAVPAAVHAQNITFPHDGLDRQYQVHIPDDVPESPAMVLVLHGLGMNNGMMMNFYGWTELADERGFIVVFPNGTRDQSNIRFWDVDYAIHEGLDIDDDGFLRELALYMQNKEDTIVVIGRLVMDPKQDVKELKAMETQAKETMAEAKRQAAMSKAAAKYGYASSSSC